MLPKFWSYQGENFYTLTSFFLVSSCLRVSLSTPKQYLRVYFKKYNFLKHGRHEGTSLWSSFKGMYCRSTVKWQPPAANLCLHCGSQWLDTGRQYTRVSQWSCLTGASLQGSHELGLGTPHWPDQAVSELCYNHRFGLKIFPPRLLSTDITSSSQSEGSPCLLCLT